MYVTVYVYMNVCGVHTTVLMQRSEDSLKELALFYHVGPRNQIQVVRLGNSGPTQTTKFHVSIIRPNFLMT